jgi:hypothetical protein
MESAAARFTPVLRSSALGLAVCTAIGLLLRLSCVGESPWLDELHTGWTVGGSWPEVAARAHIGNQSPLWFWAEKLIYDTLGHSEFSLRLLSLVCGTALIPIAYWITMRLASAETRPLAGLVAAVLVATDPDFIFFATEARPYAAVQLVAALQFAAFVQCCQQPNRSCRWWWIVLSALAFHLHYSSILVLTGEIAFIATVATKRAIATSRLRQFGVDLLLFALLCLPALPHVLAVGARRDMWQSMAGPADLVGAAQMFRFDVLLALGAIVAGVRTLKRKSPGVEPMPDYNALRMTLLWLACPVLLALVVTRLNVAELFARRYLIGVALGWPIAAALLVDFLPRSGWRPVVGLAAVVGAVATSGVLPSLWQSGQATVRGEDWRGALQHLSEEARDSNGYLFLDARLVEDRLTHPRINADPAWLAEQIDYRCFALRSLYDCPVPPDRQRPCSLLCEESGRIPSGEHWLIVREGEVDSEKIALALRCLNAPLRVGRPRQFAGVAVVKLEIDSLEATKKPP